MVVFGMRHDWPAMLSLSFVKNNFETHDQKLKKLFVNAA